MAENEIKALIKVNADTSGATYKMNELGNAIGATGDKAEKSGLSITGMVKSAANGFAVFNQAVGGVNTAFDMLNKSIDTAINQARSVALEKMLPTGTVDRFREATDRMIGRQDVLRLSVKGLTGDFKLTDTEMKTVLQTSVALSQKTGEHADVIADKLLDALAKGVNKLDDYGINLEKTKDRQADVNAAMSKFHDIIAENPVDGQTKSLVQLKDSLMQIGGAIASIVAEAAKAVAWIGENWKEYAPDLFGGTADNERKAIAEKAKRDWEEAHRGRVIGMGGGYTLDAENLSRERMIDGMPISQWREKVMKEYDEKYGAVDDSKGLKAQKFTGPGGSMPVYVVNAREVGEHVVTPFSATGEGDFGEAAWDSSALDRLERNPYGWSSTANQIAEGTRRRGIGALGSYQGQSFGHGSGEGAALYGQMTDGYDPNDPTGSLSASITKKNFAAGGAFDAGMAGAIAGMDAMITGQQAVGKAIANASAQALKAKSIEWGVFALGELAWGIADSAMLLPTAAGHFAAAAKFGAAAAAAGLGAAALGALAGGGGGQSGAAGVSAGGGYASGPGGSAARSGGDTYVINMGDGFYGDSEKTAKAVAQAVRQATRQGQRQLYSSNFSG